MVAKSPAPIPPLSPIQSVKCFTAMVNSIAPLTLAEFFALPETDVTYQLVEGEAIAKMSPKGFHAAVQTALVILFQPWCEGKGRIYTEWAIALTRNGKDWVPVPDLTYISFDRLARNWMKDEACPIAPELVIEIISPGQSFGDLAEKAADYLKAGVSRVWIIDTQARSLTIFYPDTSPETLKGTTPLQDTFLPQLQLTPQQIFRQAGFSE